MWEIEKQKKSKDKTEKAPNPSNKYQEQKPKAIENHKHESHTRL